MWSTFNFRIVANAKSCVEGRPAICVGLRAHQWGGAKRLLCGTGGAARADRGQGSGGNSGGAGRRGRLHAGNCLSRDPVVWLPAGGQIVAINGAGGGVGVHAIQIAKLLGARVIAVTTSAGKVKRYDAAGADHVWWPRWKLSETDRRVDERPGRGPVRGDRGRADAGAEPPSVRRGGRVVVVGNPQWRRLPF